MSHCRKGKRRIEKAQNCQPLEVGRAVPRSTHLWATVPDLMATALHVHHTLIRRLIAKYNLYEVKHIGRSDGQASFFLSSPVVLFSCYLTCILKATAAAAAASSYSSLPALLNCVAHNSTALPVLPPHRGHSSGSCLFLLSPPTDAVDHWGQLHVCWKELALYLSLLMAKCSPTTEWVASFYFLEQNADIFRPQH